MQPNHKIDDGGPAFARAGAGWIEEVNGTPKFNRPVGGATLRDYFASHALQSLAANFDGTQKMAGVISADAYALADAMIQARRGQ